MQITFFMPMIPPTVTHQEHKVMVRNGKPFFYEPAELKTARAKLLDSVGRHKPKTPLIGPLRLVTKWIWRKDGLREFKYKPTKPDTDNLIKLLKDCMTKAGFWKDDAQIASEITEKFWGDIPGIFISVETLDDG